MRFAYLAIGLIFGIYAAAKGYMKPRTLTGQGSRRQPGVIFLFVSAVLIWPIFMIVMVAEVIQEKRHATKQVMPWTEWVKWFLRDLWVAIKKMLGN